MQRIFGQVLDGVRPVPYAQVSIYQGGSASSLATIYDPNQGLTPTTPISNPLTADGQGRWICAVPDATYNIQIEPTMAPSFTIPYYTVSTGGVGGATNWGSITGSLSAQTDLVAALAGKASTATFGTSFDGLVPHPTTVSGKVLSDNGTWVAMTGGSAIWGGISGTLSAQTDLQTALNGKAGIALFNNTDNGLTPATGGASTTKYLRADQTWVVPPYPATFTGSGVGLVPASPGGTTKYLGADGAWSSPAPSANSYTVWDPDKPPTSPSAYDDEFEGGPGLDGKWTTVNFGLLVATDVNSTVPGCLYEQAANRGATIMAALQAIPAGDFTIYAKASIVSNTGNSDTTFSIVLSSTNTAGTGTQQHIFIRNSGIAGTNTTYGSAYIWTNFNTVGAVILTSSFGKNLNYIRIRRSGANYYIGFSENGKLWTDFNWTPGVSPSYFGIGYTCNQVSRSDLAFEFFRYFPSATAVLGGSRTILTT